MNKTFTQFIAAAIGPLLTLVCTAAVVHYIAVGAEPAKAIGAALAAALVFALAQAIETLPKRSRWWRQRFDKRAVFEGMWMQMHDTEAGRVAVFSFVYNAEGDTYQVNGDAFDSSGERLAHWDSEQVFFSGESSKVNYLWSGKAYTPEKKIEDRRGTSTMSVNRPGRSIQPISGNGEVQHLMEARALDFRLRRVTEDYIKRLGKSFAVDDLHDFERRKELALAYFAQKDHAGLDQQEVLARTRTTSVE